MKKFLCIFLALCILLIFGGCSEADKVNSNLITGNGKDD